MHIQASSHFAARLRSALAADNLHLIILPTEKCNFRCTYCYEDFSVGEMKPPVVASVKKLVDARVTDLRHLRIEWFGGEPLVAKDVVLDLSRHARDAAAASATDFTSAMTTNGYFLTPELMRDLVEARVVDYQISLDGDAEMHDRTRKRKNGTGSFDVIWGNLLRLQQTDMAFSIILRLHVTRQNQDVMESFVKSAVQIFGDDPRFSFFLKAISPLTADAVLNVPDPAVFNRISDNLRGRIGQRVLELGDSYICYAAKPNSFVIRADGTIAKCTVAFKSAKNHVGSLGEGGEIELEVDRLTAWFKGFDTLDQKFLACPVKYV